MSTQDPNDPRRPVTPPSAAAVAIPGSPSRAAVQVGAAPARLLPPGASQNGGTVPPEAPAAAPQRAEPFPREPKTWEDLGLDSSLGEQLILRLLLNIPTAAVRDLATELALAPNLLKELCEAMRLAKLVQVRGSNAVGEFIYELTELGRSKAVEARKICSYVGPAPVLFEHWVRSVRSQSLTLRNPGPDDLARAFGDLSLSEDMLDSIGPAITGSKSLFLYGDPGNGKTSLAERMTRCFGDSIWIPHTLSIDGHIVKLYDAVYHEKIEFTPPAPTDKVDRRWTKVKRPTVIAGGELTLGMLEIQTDHVAHVSEAPLQMKSNCGTFVIDDFGRQQVSPKEILNRWIFPLEKRIDFQKLPDGRKIAVPFDGLLVFSTNLEPRDLADEAFLRRIPYKIRVHDPSEDEFRTVLEALAVKMKVQLPRGSVQYLIDRHYKPTNRALRFCHPRDLLQQVVNLCTFQRRPSVAGPQEWDKAVGNYFAVMGG